MEIKEIEFIVNNSTIGNRSIQKMFTLMISDEILETKDKLINYLKSRRYINEKTRHLSMCIYISEEEYKNIPQWYKDENGKIYF